MSLLPLIIWLLLGVAMTALPILATWRMPPFSARAYWLTVLVVLAVEITWLSAVVLESGETISVPALVFTVILAALEAILLIGVLVWSAAGLIKVNSVGPATIRIGKVTLAVAALVAVLAFTTEVFGHNRSVPLAIGVIIALPWVGLFIQGRRAKPGYLRFVGIVQLIVCGMLVLLLGSMLAFAYGMTAAHSG